MHDTRNLERAIAELVAEYEQLHACEVSSLWIEHFTTPGAVKVVATTRPQVRAA